MCPEDACFLDIEATGLEHGAGTMAFLVGVAFREGDVLVTRQYLLREPSEERALLHCLLQDLDAHPMLVTFNGKSYDLSVLESRMVICRFLDKSACRLKLRPHLDLLHLSRNLHRGRWSDTRLGTLENQLLGFYRTDDLPGALVPSAWFHFLRTADATALGQAVTHNLHDVWSMVVLADHLLETAHPSHTAETLPPRVCANLGHLLLRRREFQGAVETLAPFVTMSQVEDSVRQHALDTLANAARRSHHTRMELTALQQLHSLCPTDAETLTRLAIAFERRAKDIPSALHAALELHRLSPEPHSLRRVRRLEAKLGRSRSVAC
ncbi:MAG: ribonuclease H-like domain-containing protein [Myxococcota bacterium]